MNIKVYYYTRSGNTKKLAEAVAEAVGVAANDISVPLEEKADILFLGSSLYAGGFDSAVGEFIANNANKIGTIVSFGSSASNMSTFKKVKALAQEKGIQVYDEFFNCPGHFMFMHKNRPNKADTEAAASFAKSVCAKLKTD